MEKNAKLASIYVKIYNKRTLTIDDLTFLAKYDPECFAKTCENLIYKIPETRELMTQELATPGTGGDTDGGGGRCTGCAKDRR